MRLTSGPRGAAVRRAPNDVQRGRRVAGTMNAKRTLMAAAWVAACVVGRVSAQTTAPEGGSGTPSPERYQQLEERVRVLEAEAGAKTEGRPGGDKGGGAFRFSGRPEWQRPDL